MKVPSATDINLDIDQYINRIIPPSQIYRLPKPIARFLGHRPFPPTEVGDLVVCTWSFVGAFCGIILVSGIFKSSPLIQSHDPPLIIASLGATAILDYHTIKSPLAQPRSSILGHAFSALVGVGITKLFTLRSDFEDLRWIAGAVSCAAASSVMGITNTVHPPGGATALIAAVDPAVGNLGWYFVALVILGSLLMLLCALLINNIQRQFPVFWWTPRDVGKQTKDDIERLSVAEKETAGDLLARIGPTSEQDIILITPHHLIVPAKLDIGQEERGILEVLRDRLRGMPGS